MHACRYGTTVFVPESHENSGNMDSLSKVPDSVIHEKQQQTLPFRFFQRVAKAFVPELTEVTFGRVVHMQTTEIMQIYSWKCSVHAQKTRSRRSFSEVSAKLQAE